MASVSDTVEALSALSLGNLSSEWVDEAWEQNFSEVVSLSDGSDELLSGEKWQSFLYACKGWAQNREDCMTTEDEDEVGRESFWTVLLDAGLTHKQLLVGIVALLDGKKKNVEDNLRAITVAEVYVTLLRVPGSSAFKIFHPLVYRRVVDLLTGLCPTEEGGQAQGSHTPKGKRKGRRGKRKLPVDQEEEVEEEGDATVEAMEVSDASSVLSRSDSRTVHTRLKELLQSLAVCLCEVSLQAQETSRYHLIATLTKLLYTDLPRASTPVPFDTDMRSAAFQSLPVCFIAWLCLKALCQPLHGGRGRLASEIFNQLLPVVLMVTGSGVPAQTLKSTQTVASEHAVAYISHVYSEGGDEVEKAVKALVQHVCVKTPDKADYRHRLAKVVSSLLQLTTVKLYASLVEWIYKFSRNTKVSYRVFALDLICELLEQPVRQREEGLLSPEEEERLQYKYLIKVILSRCSDKAASVRSRALSALATVASSNHVENLPKAVYLTIQDQVSPAENGGGENVIYPMLYRRAVDEKVHVRKAAVQALEALIHLNIDQVQREDVLVLRDRCQDPALLVRKQALSSLTTLTMDYPHCRLMHSFWLDGVLPMIMDRETSAQEKCASLLEEVLLNNITTYKEQMAPHEVFVWDLLHVMSGEGGREMRRYLNRTCQLWGKQKKITAALLDKVRTHAESQRHCEAAWMLLSEFVPYTKSIDVGFLSKSWQSHVSSVDLAQGGSDLLIGRVMSVARAMAPTLPHALLTKIQGDLQKTLKSFSFSPSIITAALETLIVVSEQDKGGSSQLQDLCTQLLKECETTLSAILQKEDQEVAVGNEKLIGYLFTLGEVAQLCPAHTSSHVCYIVQSLLLASTECEDVKSSLSSQQKQQLTRLDLPAVVRANAYVTLGKLCLQHEEVLRKCLLQMVQELEVAQSEAIRNNIVLILCDLIIRYSSKVDSYIPNIAFCLRDESVLIRRQTLTLLTNLFQEDYIKWKGGLFYRFAVTLVDEDAELQRYAEFCFSHLLLTKHPGMFFQHFVEGIFHFNCCQKHRVYNRFKQSERELERFSLKGAIHTSKRRRLYCLFLENMTDEQRFQVTAKLCQEVLGGVIDGSIALDDDTAPVVKDTLAILASKEIKLKSLHRGLADELAEEGDEEGAAMERARSKLISQIVKKNVIENVVPIIVATKHLFEKTRSPLLRDLMLFLKELMKDYKTEINDVLAADRQLAEEIKFDLKRFEEEQLLANVQRTPAVLTPHAQMISPLLTPGALGSPAGGKVPSSTPFTPPQLSQRKSKPKLNKEASITVTPMVLGTRKVVTGRPVNTPLSRGGGGTPPLKAAVAADSSAVATPRVGVPVKQAPFVTPKAANTLARAAILASAKRAAVLHKTPTKAPIPPELRPTICPEEETVEENESAIATSDTILVGGERVASTPHDLAQAISFHVSSLAPPSPIMVQLTNEDAQLGEGKVPPPKRGKRKATNADITLKEPAKLQQWNIKA